MGVSILAETASKLNECPKKPAGVVVRPSLASDYQNRNGEKLRAHHPDKY